MKYIPWNLIYHLSINVMLVVTIIINCDTIHLKKKARLQEKAVIQRLNDEWNQYNYAGSQYGWDFYEERRDTTADSVAIYYYAKKYKIIAGD